MAVEKTAGVRRESGGCQGGTGREGEGSGERGRTTSTSRSPAGCFSFLERGQREDEEGDGDGDDGKQTQTTVPPSWLASTLMAPLLSSVAFRVSIEYPLCPAWHWVFSYNIYPSPRRSARRELCPNPASASLQAAFGRLTDPWLNIPDDPSLLTTIPQCWLPCLSGSSGTSMLKKTRAASTYVGEHPAVD